MWLVALVALVASTESVTDNAHYIAALFLFVCILGVAVVNARRRKEIKPGAASGGKTKDHAGRGELDGHEELPAADRGPAETAADGPAGLRVVSARVARYRYTSIAMAMLVVTPILAALWLVDRIPLFWLEIVVAALFAVFWMVQTIELLPAEREPQQQSPPLPRVPAPPTAREATATG